MRKNSSCHWITSTDSAKQKESTLSAIYQLYQTKNHWIKHVQLSGYSNRCKCFHLPRAEASSAQPLSWRALLAQRPWLGRSRCSSVIGPAHCCCCYCDCSAGWSPGSRRAPRWRTGRCGVWCPGRRWPRGQSPRTRGWKETSRESLTLNFFFFFYFFLNTTTLLCDQKKLLPYILYYYTYINIFKKKYIHTCTCIYRSTATPVITVLYYRLS